MIDNGGDPEFGGNNWPRRGSKGGFYEGGVYSIGFVNSPLLANPGSTNDGLFHISDWFPTLVNLAGGSTDDIKLDGYDIWDSIVYVLFVSSLFSFMFQTSSFL